MVNVTQPQSGFVVISDGYGSIVDHLQANVEAAEVLELIQYLDANFPEKKPHSAWSCNGPFERLT